MDIKEKREKRYRRHKRVRAKIFGTPEIPRLCIFRSNLHIYGQIFDDEKSQTILSSSDLELKKPKTKNRKPKTQVKNKALKEKKEETIRTGKVAIAYEVGKLIAVKAIKKKIKKVVFDRGGYKYHGRVKALAEGARAGGLEF